MSESHTLRCCNSSLLLQLVIWPRSPASPIPAMLLYSNCFVFTTVDTVQIVLSLLQWILFEFMLFLSLLRWKLYCWVWNSHLRGRPSWSELTNVIKFNNISVGEVCEGSKKYVFPAAGPGAAFPVAASAAAGGSRGGS